MAEPIDIVRDFCAACEGGDIDAILDFFTDDAVYHNIPVAPVQGKDAIRATFDMFMTGVEQDRVPRPEHLGGGQRRADRARRRVRAADEDDRAAR